MIRKGRPLPLEKPSNMRVVLNSIEMGNRYRREIVDHTGLKEGQVRSALYNLAFIGLVKRTVDEANRSVYLSPGQWHSQVAANLKGVRSIFDVRFTTSENTQNEHP